MKLSICVICIRLNLLENTFSYQCMFRAKSCFDPETKLNSEIACSLYSWPRHFTLEVLLSRSTKSALVKSLFTLERTGGEFEKSEYKVTIFFLYVADNLFVNVISAETATRG